MSNLKASQKIIMVRSGPGLIEHISQSSNMIFTGSILEDIT